MYWIKWQLLKLIRLFSFVQTWTILLISYDKTIINLGYDFRPEGIN